MNEKNFIKFIIICCTTLHTMKVFSNENKIKKNFIKIFVTILSILHIMKIKKLFHNI